MRRDEMVDWFIAGMCSAVGLLAGGAGLVFVAYAYRLFFTPELLP